MLRCLETSREGRIWLEWMGPDMVQQLKHIEQKLSLLWRLGICYPYAHLVLSPMHLIERSKTKLILLCKAPYRSPVMACGVPVLSGDGTMTPSSKVFKSLIERYWEGVTDDNYMHLYYRSGVLVLNSCPTIQQEVDDRYSLTDSHFPLWTKFMVPFIRKMHSEGVPVVGLGVESKGLMRGIPEDLSCIVCSYPSDYKSIPAFLDVMLQVLSEYIFDTSTAQ